MYQPIGQTSAAEWRADALGLDPRQLAPAATILAKCAAYTGLAAHALQQGDPLLAGAFALVDWEARCIWYDESLPQFRLHLILAHEYAHFVLHGQHFANDQQPHASEDKRYLTPADEELTGYSPAQRRERDANSWAAELLLPLYALAYAYFDLCWTVNRIADDIQTDKRIVINRLRMLILSPDASAQHIGAALPPQLPTLESLDVSQAAAAQTPDRCVLVSAGPGTGKTKTLVARFEWLVQEKQAAADEITILTFSRRAAAELYKRVEFLPCACEAIPWIGTIHAFAYELLRRFSAEAGLHENWQVISSQNANRLMDRRLKSLSESGYPLPILPLGQLLDVVAQLKEQRIDADRLSSLIDLRLSSVNNVTLSKDAAELRQYANFYAEYQNALNKTNRLDFGDLLTAACTLLSARPDVLRLTRESCRHLLVDEFQDLTPSSLKLIELITGASKISEPTASSTSLWAVGDRLQSIYRFQSGSVGDSMSEFAQSFGHGTLPALACNYRSSEPIIALLSDVAAKLTAADAVAQTRWRSNQKAEKLNSKSLFQDISLAIADDANAEFDGIAAEIARLKQTGIPSREQAVLCRTNAECFIAAQELSRRNIEVSESNSWLRSASVKQLMHALETVVGTNDTASRNRSPWLSNDEIPPIDMPSVFLENLVFGKSTCLRNLWTAQASDSAAANELQAIGFLLQHAMQWEQAEDAPLLQSSTADKPRLTAFAHYIRGLSRDESTQRAHQSSGQSRPGVRILTVHAAKGLEFDAVYLPNMAEGAFPRRSRSKGDQVLALCRPKASTQSVNVDEESCLFFVAISRARRHLLISYSENKQSGKTVKPSPFIRLLQSTAAGKQIKNHRWHSTEPQTAGVSHFRNAASFKINEAPELSLQQVSLYEACPRRYRYELELDQARNCTQTEVNVEPASLINLEITRRQLSGIAAETKQRNAKEIQPNSPSTGISKFFSAISLFTANASKATQLAKATTPEEARRIRAASGIAARLFSAKPDSPARCAECPFFYICPE